MLKLKSLQPGGTIGVLAPAFAPDPVKVQKGTLYLQNLGYKVIHGQSLESPPAGYFSATDEIRATDMNVMFANPEIDAIICARGGWGCLRILDKLDYRVIEENPKMLVGYSDITTLHLAFWEKCRLPGLSGPMVAVEMANGILDFTSQHFWEQINNHQKDYILNLEAVGAKIWKQGATRGILLGGCLSLVASQLGTPWMPDFDNAILFIEDVGEEPYKIDRYFAQLKQAGILKKIRGLILGEFLDCIDERDLTFSIDDLFMQYFDDLTCPVIYTFPYGHGKKKVTMPVGTKVSMDTKNNRLIFQNPFAL